jgi:tRNA-2-methylthio-N6-dimethylallyladenosine synthase
VLVEGRSKRDATRWTGRTPENRVVNLPGALAAGWLVDVEITASTPYSLHGKALLT